MPDDESLARLTTQFFDYQPIGNPRPPSLEPLPIQTSTPGYSEYHTAQLVLQTIYPAPNQAGGNSKNIAALSRFMNSYLPVLGLAVALSVASVVWYSGRNQTLAAPDAAGYLMVARSILTGRRVGLMQLGNQALPLHYLLMLPLIWNDALWQSGLAGIVPSMVAYILAGVYCWRLGRLCFASVGAGWVMALILLLNPSLLYLQATPLPDLEFLAAIVLSVYYATRWAQTHLAAHLVAAAIATSAATLLRLEGWLFAVILSVIILYVAWQRHEKNYVEACGLLFGLVAFTGGVLWLIYQWVIYGNFVQPLLYSTSLAIWYAPRTLIGANVGGIFQHLGGMMLATVGWPIAALIPLGGLCWLIFSVRIVRLAPLFSLLALIASVLIKLIFSSISPTSTAQGLGNLLADALDPRSGLLALPFVAFLLASVAARQRLFLWGMLAIVIVTGAGSVFVSSPPTLQTTESRAAVVAHTEAVQVGAWLASHDTGGALLISIDTNAPALFYAHLPGAEAITEISGPLYTAALAHPERYVTWMVVDTASAHDDPIWHNLQSRQDWRPYFALSQVIGNDYIYQHAGGGREP